jgi:hypothetical protein
MNTYPHGEWLDATDDDDDATDFDAYHAAHDDEDTGAVAGCAVWGALITIGGILFYAFMQMGGG